MFGIDDYPWRHSVPNTDNLANCGYAARNCDDFTMWRWRHDLGQACGYFGSAFAWPSRAAAAGWLVTTAPAVHTIMAIPPGEQDSDRRFGHVCAVLEVGPSAHAGAGEVWCESYNWTPYAYSQNRFKVAGARFIHAVKAGPPPPPPLPPPSEEDTVQIYLEAAGDAGGLDFAEVGGIRAGQTIHLVPQDRTGLVGKVLMVSSIAAGTSQRNLTVAVGGTVPGKHGPIGADVPTSELVAGTPFNTITFENESAFRVLVTVTTP